MFKIIEIIKYGNKYLLRPNEDAENIENDKKERN